jgi:hypothetical protein
MEPEFPKGRRVGLEGAQTTENDRGFSGDNGCALMEITVRRGRTPSQLAQQYGTTWQHLAEVNGITDPRRLQVGQRLTVPDPFDGLTENTRRTTDGDGFVDRRFDPAPSRAFRPTATRTCVARRHSAVPPGRPAVPDDAHAGDVRLIEHPDRGS